ncbi:MAG: hypothetical protein IT446_07530 [Phycisphaerales bacterium]|nr:hypothetical protein [Phycisphaerales bacterium]
MIGYNRKIIVQGRILIFTAVEAEARAVARALGYGRGFSGRDAVSLRVDGYEVEIRTIGIRGVYFPNELSGQGLRAVILAGLGGGLDPTLQVGDVVVDGLERSGTICWSDELVGTAERKRELFEKSGARVVEMEGEVVRKWSGLQGVKLIGVRSVSDRADQELDGRLLGWVDGWGRPRWGKLLWAIARRPQRVGALWRLGRDGRRACGTLGPAVRRVIGQLKSFD